MSVICFMGMDGSGKTSVIQGITPWLEAKGLKVQRLHTHDYNVPALNKVNTLGKEEWIRKYPFLFVLWPYFALLDHIKTYKKKFSDKSTLILTDRYFYDKYVRFRFWGIALPGLFYLYKWFLPRPKKTIFLDVPPEIAFQRKGEYSLEDYGIFRREYLTFIHKVGFIEVIDATQPLPAVIESVKAKLNEF